MAIDIYGNEKKSILLLKQCGLLFAILLVFLLSLLLLSPVAQKVMTGAARQKAQQFLDATDYAPCTVGSVVFSKDLLEANVFMFRLEKDNEKQGLVFVQRMQTLYGCLLGLFVLKDEEEDVDFLCFFDVPDETQEETMETICKEQIRHAKTCAYNLRKNIQEVQE